MRFINFLALVTIFFAGSAVGKSVTQSSGGNILYGDVNVDEQQAGSSRALTLQIILYNLGGHIVSRQTVSSNGRYRFNNVNDGEYDLVVELENSEVARIRVQLRSAGFKTDHRQDISLAWKSVTYQSSRPGSISAEDAYQRSPENQKRFDRAQQATDKKKFVEAITFLKQILSDDPKDFQAWTELGTVHLVREDADEAAKAYRQAVEVRPRFFLALMNLGRLLLLQKDYEGAVIVFTRAVEVKATSPEANYYLGEAYLQVKKGSKAVIYLNEALKLDPVGRADAHLRLAALYNAAGMKAKAAVEYEEFLKKKPDYPDKKKLEQYIAANKGTAEAKKP